MSRKVIWAGEPDVSSLSVLWLLPQFALIATGEAFVYPARSPRFCGGNPSGVGFGVWRVGGLLILCLFVFLVVVFVFVGP